MVLVYTLLLSCSSGKYKPKKNLKIVFYNVENLFDLENEPGKRDGEFTPGGSKKWTKERYNKKLQDLSKVLVSIDSFDLPEVVGLCEVENINVVGDLFKTGALASGGYGLVHFESPDFRGIDCALAYRKPEMEVLDSKAINVSFDDDPGYVTRDVLYVKGKMKNKQVFHFFVNHWPSRIGGLEKTSHKRKHVAAIVKTKVDSILAEEPGANIVIMGDMNDEPHNASIAEILGAHQEISPSSVLVNMMAPQAKQGKGSYNFRGNWNMLDNIIVSKALFDGKGYDCITGAGEVFSKEWMEYKNKEGKVSPNRTYGGPNYYGGISDHFPVYISLGR